MYVVCADSNQCLIKVLTCGERWTRLTRKPDLDLVLDSRAQLVHHGDLDHLALSVVAHAAGALLVARLPAQPAALLLALARLVALLLRAPRRRAHHRRAEEVVREVGPQGDHKLIIKSGTIQLESFLEGSTKVECCVTKASYCSVVRQKLVLRDKS